MSKPQRIGTPPINGNQFHEPVIIQPTTLPIQVIQPLTSTIPSPDLPKEAIPITTAPTEDELINVAKHPDDLTTKNQNLINFLLTAYDLSL